MLTMKNWVAQVVYWQLDRWFAEILGEGSELNLEKMLSKDDLKRLKEFLGREPKQVLKIGTLKEFYGRDGSWNTILRFVGFIESTILKQAESFLRKYEEEISTMPQGFSKPDDDKKPLLPKWKKVGVFAARLDSADVRSNWIEQLTNAAAQAAIFTGILFLF